MDKWAVARVAIGLLDAHGLTDLGWRFGFDREEQFLGSCWQDTREITMSDRSLGDMTEEEVRRVVLHEIAHALVGPEHNHDEVFRSKALEIGGDPNSTIALLADQEGSSWVGVCPGGHRLFLRRSPDRPLACDACSDVFQLANLYAWTHKGRPATMHPNYDWELQALSAGKGPEIYADGVEVRILEPAKWHGLIGTVAGAGYTRYQVELSDGRIVRPYFAHVERASTSDLTSTRS